MEHCVGLTLRKIDAVSMNNLHKATKVNIISKDENSNISGIKSSVQTIAVSI